MIYAIISDIHANASALRKVLADAWKEGATHIACLGDVVGYGPEPARALAMLRIEKPTIVAGNHDDAVSGRIDASDFVSLAADAVSRHREALRDDEKEWLGALPYIANIEGGAVCVHGDLTAPREFRYIETPADAAANFAVCENALIFVGHTHEPCLFVTGKSGKTYKTSPQDFTVEPGKRYIVNVGSVGYPRETNGTCLSSYVIYDSERREVRFRFLPFSVASVMQRGASPSSAPKTDAEAAMAGEAKSAAPNPACADKRERRIVMWAFLAIVAIFVLALAAAIASRKPPPDAMAPGNDVKGVEKANVETPDNSSPVKKTIIIRGRETKVRPNLEIKKKSTPVKLTINYLNQAGAVVSRDEQLVKERCTRGFPISRNIHRVEFIVVPEKKGETMSIKRFAPEAE